MSKTHDAIARVLESVNRLSRKRRIAKIAAIRRLLRSANLRLRLFVGLWPYLLALLLALWVVVKLEPKSDGSIFIFELQKWMAAALTGLYLAGEVWRVNARWARRERLIARRARKAELHPHPMTGTPRH